MKTNYIKPFAIMATLAAAPIAFAQTTEEQEAPVVQAEAKIGPGSLATVIADSKTFSILTKALEAAGLNETLGGTDNYTIFAPTDEAFMKLPEGTLEKLLLPANQEKLRSLLLYHVIAGKVMSTDLTDDMEVTTANAEMVEIDIDGEEVKVNDAKVFSVDVPATNGVMHSVGEVIIPESLNEFLGIDE